MPTALVTGAAGFIGSHLVEGLLERGYRVRGLDNLTTGDRTNLDDVWDSESFAFVEGDIRDAETVRQAMADVDSVFHQAAFVSVPGSVEHPARATDVNCTGTATILEAARDQNVERVVCASSAAVYGSDPPVPTPEDALLVPESPYAHSKRYGEQLAAQLDVETVALRYFNVFGPKQDPAGEYAAVIPAFIERMLDDQRPVIYGDGEQTRDFVSVRDVVDANVCAAETDLGRTEGTDGGASGADGTVHTYNVASGERISITELVETLNDLLGTALDPIYDDPRPGDVRHSGADISRTQEALGYESRVGFREGLDETIAFFRK